MSASRFREQPKLAFQVPSAGTVQSREQAWSYPCEAQNNQQLDIYWIIAPDVRALDFHHLPAMALDDEVHEALGSEAFGPAVARHVFQRWQQKS